MRFIDRIFSRDNETGLSLPLEKKVYGVTVRRLPVGAYAKAISSLESLPDELLQACFPNLTPNQIVKKVGNIDIAILLEILTKAFAIMPEKAVMFIAELIDVPFETLWGKPEIGLNGLKEIVKGFWKLNDLSDFCEDLGRMVKKNKMMQSLVKNLPNQKK